MRSVDGTLMPLGTAEGPSIPALIATAPPLCAPIYDTRGEPLAFIELIPPDANPSGSSQTLLRALIEATARAITERWFRICHRRHWIIAARRTRRPHIAMLLAVDDNQKLVGADRQARELLAARHQDIAPCLELSSLLQAGAAPFRGKRYRDLALRILGSHDGVPWSTLITPPIPAIGSRCSEPVRLHARPRLDTIRQLEVVSSEREELGGLPPRMLRSIQDYIDAHLESALDIDTLAANLGLSVSHFGRCFRKSVGLTPHRYIMRRRVLRAQELLVQTERALADIALTAGFSDQSHFSRRFHQLTGVPPKAFRAQHR
jgi:AraC-like DNA-binding protein